MPTPTALRPGDAFPSITWPTVAHGELDLAAQPGWRILIVYRGRHCPLCKTYFKALDSMLEEFAAAGISVAGLSADPLAKAQADVESEGWRFPIAYGLSLDEMRTLGLFISAPRSAQETDAPFAEPGMFVVNPSGQVQTMHIGNASYTRSDLKILLRGLKYTIDNGLPIRGTMR